MVMTVSEEIEDGQSKLDVEDLSMDDDDLRSLIGKVNNKDRPLRQLSLCLNSYAGEEPATSQFTEFAKAIGAHPTLIKFHCKGGTKYVDNNEQAVLLKELSKNRSIKHLGFETTNFDMGTNRALLETLNNNQTLLRLDLQVSEDYSVIAEETMFDLIRSLQTTVLEHLKIRKVDDKGFEFLLQHLPPTLICLDLYDNDISDASFPALQSFIKSNRTLKQLILDHYLASTYLEQNNNMDASEIPKVLPISSLEGILASKEYNLVLSTDDMTDNDWAMVVDELTKGNYTWRHLKATIHDKISSTHLKQLLTVLKSEQCRLKDMVLMYRKPDKVKQINLFHALSKNKSINNINFHQCKFDSDAFGLLFNHHSDKSPITHLRIYGDINMGDEEVIALAQALEKKTNLQELILDNISIGDKGCQVLLNSLPSSVEVLILLDNLITAISLPDVLSFVKKHTQLKRVTLMNTSISKGSKEVNVPDIIEEIRKAGEDNNCNCAIFVDEPINSDRIPEVGNDEMDLSSEHLRDDHIIELCDALKLQSTDSNRNWSLNLTGNPRISSIGIQHLTNNLPTLSIVKLSLASCEMNDEKVKILFSGLDKNNTLKSLNMSSNEFGSKGIKYISRYLQNNTTLIDLNLLGNQLNDDGAARLASVLSKTHLEELDLTLTLIGDRGCASILSSLPTSLIKLTLSYNEITESSLDTIIQFLTANRTLKDLHMSGNPIFKQDDDSEEPNANLVQAKKAAEQNNICELHFD